MKGRTVAVFGAGVAGLTAAHELVERGFDVHVYELEAPRALDEECTIGGMARTQWARTDKCHVRSSAMKATTPLRFRFEKKDRVYFSSQSSELNAEQKHRLAELAARIQQAGLKEVDVYGYTYERGRQFARCATLEPDDNRDDAKRARAVAAHLLTVLPSVTIGAVAAGLGEPMELNRTEEDRCFVELHAIEDWIPGEHGFRFFPSFYRHLFDTMRRIPLAEEDPPFRETGRTVYDNLIPTVRQSLAFHDHKPLLHPRHGFTSWRELLDYATSALEALGCTFEDAARLQRSVFKYLTSCDARRHEYENLSWWEFIDGDRYSERFRRYLDEAPEILVAMRARASDARTIGTIVVQLLADQLQREQRTDATLNEPTNIAWFDPWRRYLEHQGVWFRRGRLLEIPKDDCGFCTVVEMPDEIDPTTTKTVLLEYAYYVVAVPLHEAKRLAEESAYTEGDFGKLRTLNLTTCHAHLAGIQYYFDTDVPTVRGHTMYMDSPWGLSSISQPQFWTRQRGDWSGYRGILSVDVANWHRPGLTSKKTAWQSSGDEIAAEVWIQIKKHLKQSSNDSCIPEPILYHLDEGIAFRDDGKGPADYSRTPFVINRPSEYRNRPGTPGAYILHDSKIVFAGAYTQTYTRLTTMEAANESARHAVNAILEHASAAEGRLYPRCMIANPEQHEPADLQFLVELDERLKNEDLPHFADAFGLDFDPIALLAARWEWPGGR